MPDSIEPIEQSSPAVQADRDPEPVVAEAQPEAAYDKPTIRKVDESRHGDFWCD